MSQMLDHLCRVADRNGKCRYGFRDNAARPHDRAFSHALEHNSTFSNPGARPDSNFRGTEFSAEIPLIAHMLFLATRDTHTTRYLSALTDHNVSKNAVCADGYPWMHGCTSVRKEGTEPNCNPLITTPQCSKVEGRSYDGAK